jgi:hypothetical protein
LVTILGTVRPEQARLRHDQSNCLAGGGTPRALLTVHATVEEEVFYPAAREAETSTTT